MKLTDIYTTDEIDDENEALCHAVSEAALEFDFEPRALPHARLAELLTHMGDVSVLEAMSLHADAEQLALIDMKVASFDETRVVVLHGLRVIDGNHHLAAAQQAGKDLKCIDLADVIEPEEPAPI